MGEAATERATLALVRHADAGDRQRWQGDDRLRPLTKIGHRQAEDLVAALATFPVGRVLSSPYRRCIETVAPLAERRGLPVEPHAALAEGATEGVVLDALTRAPHGAVLCSHGDVIAIVVGRLVRERLVDRHAEAAKGSTWVLERIGRRFTAARYLPPPESSRDSPS